MMKKVILLIVTSFIIASMLTILPLPGWAIWFRPQWIVLVLIYWVIALPNRVGLMTAWVVGLFIDILQGTLLGEHALAMTIVAYITLKFHHQLRVSTLWMQIPAILALLCLFQLIIMLVQGVLGEMNYHWQYSLSLLTSVLLWPWTFVLLHNISVKYRVVRTE